MFVAHKTNIKKLAVILISSGFLAACNQVGSNSNSTSTNATEHAAVENTKESQKVLRIVNHSSSVIDHINILNESGQVIFKSTTGLNCKNNQDCNVDLNGLITTEAMIAKLYNAKNQLVSMVKLKDNSQKLKYTTVYANDTIFGAQLFKNLIIAEKVSGEVVFKQLINFFGGSNQSMNVLTGLGAYYSEQLANGRIHNDEEFYKLLINDMKHGKVISGKKLLARAYVPELRTSLMSCNNENVNKVFDTIAPFGKIIPGGEAIAGVAEEAKAIYNWTCPAETVDFKAEFDQINEKLDTIQDSVLTVTKNVQEFRDMVNNQTLAAEQVTLESLYSQEDTFNRVYYNFMDQVNEKESVNKFQSFHQYVNSQGGLDKFDNTTYAPISNDINGIVRGLPNQYNSLNELINHLPYLVALLNAQCSDLSKISGDIIAKRNYCNLITMQVGVKVAAYARMSQLRMSDAVAAINSSPHPEKYSNPFSDEKGKGITWSKVPQRIIERYEQEMESINTFYKKTLITPAAGLDQTLVDSLNADGNPLRCVESTPSGVRGVVEWYLNKDGKGLSNTEKYIVTSCYQDSALESPVTSKYFYGADGLKVINILGILAGKDAIDKILNDHSALDYTYNIYKTLKNTYSKIDNAMNDTINTKDLPGLEISGQPYILNYDITDSPFIPIGNNLGYDMSIFDNQAHWSYQYNSPIVNANYDSGVINYYLRFSANDQLEYKISEPKSWLGSRNGDGAGSNKIYVGTVTPIYWPVLDNNNKPIGETIVFGFVNMATVNGKGTNRYGNQIGLECLSSKCLKYKNSEGRIALYYKLDNGKVINITLGWHGNDGLFLRKNVY